MSIIDVRQKLLFLFLLISPLIFIPTIYNPFETPKFVLIIIASVVLALVYLYKPSQTKIDSVTKILLLYIVVLFVADLAGVDPRISLLGTPIRHQGFLLSIASVLLFLTGREVKTDLSKILSLSFISVTVFAFIQALLNHFANLNFPTYQGRIVGTMGNPDFLGGYIAITLPFLITSKLSRNLKLFFGSLSLIVLLLSSSRSAIIVFLLILFYYGRKYINRYTLLALVMGFSILIIIPNPLVKSLSRASIWDNRSLLWSESIKAIANRPILGYGQENYELVFPQKYMLIVDNSHNIFIETALSCGFIGLIVFVSLLFLGFKNKPKTIKISILAFLFVASFNPVSVAELALFWFLLGLTNKHA